MGIKNRETVLQLDDDYRVESDYACWTLYYEKMGDVSPKTGKPMKHEDVSYHANLKQALIKYCEDALKGEGDIPALIERIKQCEANVEAAVDRLYAQLSAE